MKTKIISIIIIFTVIFSMVSIFWLDNSSRKVNIFKLRDTIEDISINSEDFRNDMELTTAILELIEFCYQDLGADYSFKPQNATELSGEGEYFSILVTSVGEESTRILRIHTSYTLDDIDEFKEFAQKVILFYTSTFAHFRLLNDIQEALTPDGESWFIIAEILKSIYKSIQVTIVGVRLIISSIPLIITILVDGLTVVKDFIILPFRLFI